MLNLIYKYISNLFDKTDIEEGTNTIKIVTVASVG